MISKEEPVMNSEEKGRKSVYDPLTITDKSSGTRYYGGDQEWYSSNTMAFAGCGSVAAANMLRALAYKYPEEFSKDSVSKEFDRLREEELYKDDFTKFMGEIYKSMLVLELPVIRKIYDLRKRGKKPLNLPPSFGLSLNGFIRGTLKYAMRRGLKLHAHALPTAFCKYKKGLEFIKEGLNKSGSVVMMTSMNRHSLRLYRGKSGELTDGYEKDRGVRSHFMTITGIEEREGQAPLIKITTWGRVATVPYDELNRSWHSIAAFTSCLYYFTPAGSEAVVKADIRNSYGVTIKAVFKGLFGWL